MKRREGPCGRITQAAGAGIIVMVVAATLGCLTPGQSRDLQTQLREIRRQVDQLEMQQEHSRQAVDETLTRVEPAAPAVRDFGAVQVAAADAGRITESDVMNMHPSAGAPDPSAAGGADAVPDPTSRREADVLYRQGYALHHRGDHAGAERTLRSFLSLVPDSPRADNAQYWIGETFYSRGLYREAIREFTRVVTDYPQGNKAAHALYKIALCHEQLGEMSLARVNLEALVRTYPDSDAAPLARERLQAR